MPRRERGRPGSYPTHLRWIRSLRCAVENGDCGGRIQAAHYRTGTGGGTGMKPGDQWTWPACAFHHDEQHRIGEPEFERRYGINLREICLRLAGRSPDRRAREGV